MSDTLVGTLLSGIVSIAVALIAIIPSVITNRKKTIESITEQNDKIEEQIEKIENSLNSHIEKNESDSAKDLRRNILRFDADLREGRHFGKEYFDDVLDDIDEYESFCEEHPKFKNNKGKMAMEHIKECYKNEYL